jgi:DNA-directed RNA polymerase III subunit RPC8
MFVLANMVDTVRLSASSFSYNTHTALIHALNKCVRRFANEFIKIISFRKLANRIILDTGLCICIYDIQRVVDAYILPGDAASHTKGLFAVLLDLLFDLVYFRACVFRPFVDEVCVGKIRANTPQGLHLSLTFFDDIFVPADKLPHPSHLYVLSFANFISSMNF